MCLLQLVVVTVPFSSGAVLDWMKDGKGKITPRPEVWLERLGQGTSPKFFPSHASTSFITQCTV